MKTYVFGTLNGNKEYFYNNRSRRLEAQIVAKKGWIYPDQPKKKIQSEKMAKPTDATE